MGFMRKISLFIHNALIMLLVVLVAMAFSDKYPLVALYKATSPVSDWFAMIFGYFRLLDGVISSVVESRAYVISIYLVMCLIFINLFAAVYPPFKGTPSNVYDLSFSGYSRLMEDHIYGKLSPSISLDGLSRSVFIVATPQLGQKYIEASSYTDLLWRYFRDAQVWRRIFFSFILLSFVILPAIIYAQVNYLHDGINKLLIPLFLMIYGQVRSVFEIVVCGLCLIRKNPLEGN